VIFITLRFAVFVPNRQTKFQYFSQKLNIVESHESMRQLLRQN